MSREVIESVRIVIKSPCGNRLVVEGKGNAVHGMHSAFMCLTPSRRENLLSMLTKTHDKMSAKEQEQPAGEGEK